jgi:hypothetical protein
MTLAACPALLSLATPPVSACDSAPERGVVDCDSIKMRSAVLDLLLDSGGGAPVAGEAHHRLRARCHLGPARPGLAGALGRRLRRGPAIVS